MIQPLLKPAKRGPKARKPIPRSKGFIKRGSRPARVRRTPRGQEQESLNRLFSRYIRKRDPLCAIRNCLHDVTDKFKIKAALKESPRSFSVGSGPQVTAVRYLGVNDSTDAAHLLGKGSHPTIRHHKDNAVGACRPCHSYYTTRPTAWLAWVLNRIGPEKYDELVELSRGPSPDREKVRAELTEALKALKP